MDDIHKIEQLAAASWPSYFRKTWDNGFFERTLV